MNPKILSFIVAIICSLAVYSQQPVENTIGTLVESCHEIIKLNESIEQLKNSIQTAEEQVNDYYKSWEKACDAYINSSNQCIEYLDFLLKHTDKNSEKELYERISTARSKMTDNQQKNDVTKPEATDVTTPMPVEDPKFEKFEDSLKSKDSRKSDVIDMGDETSKEGMKDTNNKKE